MNGFQRWTTLYFVAGTVAILSGTLLPQYWTAEIGVIGLIFAFMMWKLFGRWNLPQNSRNEFFHPVKGSLLVHNVFILISLGIFLVGLWKMPGWGGEVKEAAVHAYALTTYIGALVVAVFIFVLIRSHANEVGRISFLGAVGSVDQTHV